MASPAGSKGGLNSTFAAALRALRKTARHSRAREERNGRPSTCTDSHRGQQDDTQKQ